MEKILIVEDELTAAEKLISMLERYYPDSEMHVCQSVEETINRLENDNINYDIGFFDIQLADDLSFEIFKRIDIKFPVIFTTAFDEFIMKALEEKAIDYLLKPLTAERLDKAIQKVSLLENHFNAAKIQGISSNQSYRHRYLVRKGTDFVSLKVEDIAYAFTSHKVSFLVDRNGVKYIVDKSITTLYEELDPIEFFRANRKMIIHIDAISKFKSEGGKILLEADPPTQEVIVISKETAPKFREWIDR